MSESLKEFCDRTSRETWKGTDTAYRSGAKAALYGGESNYILRQDFGDAWKRGYDAMEQYLNAGGKITQPVAVAARPYNRRVYGEENRRSDK